MRSYQFEFEKKKNKNFRQQNPTTTQETVKELIEHYKLGEKFTELDIKASWKKIMGDSVARRTISLNIQNNILYVRLESASLKQELLMRKTNIVQQLNLFAGKEVVTDINLS